MSGGNQAVPSGEGEIKIAVYGTAAKGEYEMAVARQEELTDIESVICRLKDVISARVVTGDTGDISEIHVLTESTRTPKQVVRDIESAVMAKLGIGLDHRKVSIAQVAGNAPRQQGRLKFSDVSISLDGSRAEATVHLQRDGIVYTGTASGLSSSNSQMRLISTSTLRAVEDAGAADGSMVVEDMSTGLTLAGKSIVVVLVNELSDRGDNYLTGSAVVKQDLWKAVVNATLDAINRRVTLTSD